MAAPRLTAGPLSVYRNLATSSHSDAANELELSRKF